MQVKSVLESKRSWFNYGSILALGVTALLADAEFVAMIKDTLGVKGTIGMMIVGALVNQYLAQTSTKRPTFKTPRNAHLENLRKLEDEQTQADDTYSIKPSP
jgi:hypothetical protein